MPLRVDRHPHQHGVARLATHLSLFVDLLHQPIVPGAGIGGQDVIDRQIPAGLLRDEGGPVDVAQPVVRHVHLQLPGAGLVGDAHQRLALLHRAKREPVANLPGDDHAVDRTADLEVVLLRLVELPLLLEALDLPLQLGRPAGEPGLLVGRDLLVFQKSPPRGHELLLARRLAAEHVGERHFQVGVAERGQQLPLLHAGTMLEAGFQLLDHAVDSRKDVATVNRLERALPLQPQFGRDEDERQDRRHRRQGSQHRPRQIAGRRQHPRFSHQFDQPVERQAGVGESIRDRHLAMLGNEVDAGPLAGIEAARREPLGHDRPDRLGGRSDRRLRPRHRHGIDAAGLHHRRGPRLLQRNDRERSGMGFVDVVLELLLDLGREFFGRVGVPERIARHGHDANERLDGLHGRGPPLHRLLAAHRLQPQLPPPPHEHAHPVAADDPPRLVGKHEGRGHGVERFMHSPTEPLHLRERGLLVVERFQLPPVEIVAGHGRHLLEERQIAPLDIGQILLVKHLDQAGANATPVDRRRDHEERGIVGRNRATDGPARTELRMRGHEQARGALHERLHEGSMGGLGLRRGRDAGVFHAGMADRLDAAPFAHEPDEPGHRLHRHEHPLEQTAEKLGLGRVGSRELLDLGDERPDLAACPFDFDRLVDAHLNSVRPHSRACVIVLQP